MHMVQGHKLHGIIFDSVQFTFIYTALNDNNSHLEAPQPFMLRFSKSRDGSIVENTEWAQGRVWKAIASEHSSVLHSKSKVKKITIQKIYTMKILI